ncbi:MAG: tyrosinase family protein [Alphaproteobacteria bacterium]|nr:tyrosinase family protein [Alphaproteobacteria bacterium]
MRIRTKCLLYILTLATNCTSILAMDQAVKGEPTVLRKNVNTLTSVERSDYVRGCYLLKNEVVTKGVVKGQNYTNTYDFYVVTYMQDSVVNHSNFTNQPSFLPWHRQFILQFEKDLQRVLQKPSFALPYWDWTEDAALPDPKQASIWASNFMGGDGDNIIIGKSELQTTTWVTVPDSQRKQTGTTLSRAMGRDPKAPTLPTLADVNYALECPTYEYTSQDGKSEGGLRITLEGLLDNPQIAPNFHQRVCQWIGGTMSVPSPNDPAYFLHLCNIDRIWAIWQEKRLFSELSVDRTSYPRGSRYSKGQNLDDNMEPWDTSMVDPTPYEWKTPGVSCTPGQVINYRTLGYRYSNLTPPPYFVAITTSDEGIINLTASNSGITWNLPISQNPGDGIRKDYMRTGHAVSMTTFNDQLWLATCRPSSSGIIDLSSTSDGIKWGKVLTFPGDNDRRANDISMASFNKKLWLASTMPGSGALQISNNDGTTTWNKFETSPRETDRRGSAISIATFLNRLYVATCTNNNYGYIQLSSTDGETWDDLVTGPGDPERRASYISLASFKDKFYMASSNPGNGQIQISSSTDGTKWEETQNLNWTASPLQLISSPNRMLLVTSKPGDCIVQGGYTEDGTTWIPLDMGPLGCLRAPMVSGAYFLTM